jgi:hypothetical protein
VESDILFVLHVNKGKAMQETLLTYYKVALTAFLYGSDSWKFKEKDINRKQLANVRYVKTDRSCSRLNHIWQRRKTF